MTEILVGSTLNYDVQQPTTFLLQIAAGMTSHQHVYHEKLTFDPGLNVEDCQVGAEGNRLHRIVVQPCQLTINYRATVEMTPDVERSIDVGETQVAQIPPKVLMYLNPSRYCESDLLGRFAFEEFGNMDRGFSRVQAICDWVSDHLDYEPGSTNVNSTAADVLLQRAGVCRDYAHLAISLCRGIGIPARYVAGYAVNLQPPDYHGFMEAFLDGQWYLFDPTRLASTVGLVRIGVGRDAADVAFSSFTGVAKLTNKEVWANYSHSEPNSDQSSAVSTA